MLKTSVVLNRAEGAGKLSRGQRIHNHVAACKTASSALAQGTAAPGLMPVLLPAASKVSKSTRYVWRLDVGIACRRLGKLETSCETPPT
ncbi:MAG: hypothetical protein MUF54_16205 [Polyangiaceae bacterium]|jgi:hypothetical protein|nr:hypothetical protein [Polyangiaceae bacterium]